ncbi:CsbD family protein [Rhizobium mongolense]|uniref:CsbD family protein n=1 Tax=Rhizobium mongolense TaxID=57676 RepID=UPI0034A53DA2
MGSASDKVSGMANKAAGNIKQAAGKATGSREMQAKGRMQEMKGEAQEASVTVVPNQGKSIKRDRFSDRLFGHLRPG